MKIDNLKNAFIGILMKNTDQSVKNSQWCEIVTEFQKKFPEIFSLVISIMLRPEDLRCFTKVQSVLPKVAMIYGIIAQARNVELSHVQRVMSMVLVDNICDQKVFKLQNY